jgi:hypothetical protein
MRVVWCRECGRLGAEVFSYCPFCGAEYAAAAGFEDALAGGMRRVEERTRAIPRDRFGRALRQLEEIERDVQDIMDEEGWLTRGKGRDRPL